LNPGRYSDIPDGELGRIWKDQHPGQYDDFVEVALMPHQSNLPSRQPSQQLDSLVTELDELSAVYRNDRGRLTSWWQRGKAEGRAKLLAALNAEMQQIIQAINLRAEAHGLAWHHNASMEMAKLLHRNQMAILEIATSLGMDQVIYQQKLLMQLEVDKELLLASEHSRLRIEEARQLSDVEFEKHQKMKALEIQHRWEEIQQDLRSGFIYQNEAHEQLNLLREYINGRYKEAASLRGSKEPGAKRQLKLLEQHIAVMEGLFRDQQQGLLQIKAQKDPQASDSDTDLR
jgi:hypothetical protein